MTPRRKRLAIAIAVIGAAVLAIGVVTLAVLPNWLRGSLERTVGAATGRKLEIAGPFELTWSLTPKLVAEGVTLGNAPWGTQPFTMRAGRVAVVIDLRSLWSGPVRVLEIELDDVHVYLERDAEGRANWTFDAKRNPSAPAARRSPLPFTIERASIRQSTLAYRAAGDTRSMSFGVHELDARHDIGTGRISLRGSGELNDAPWDLTGWLGSFDNVVEGHDVDQEVTGHIARTALSVRGRIADVVTLGGPNVEVTLDGPDIAAALAVLGLETRLNGPFKFRSALVPVDGGIGIDAGADVGDLSLVARGTIGAILDPSTIDVAIKAAGPDAAFVGTLLGVGHLPPRSFDLTGRILRSGRNVTCENVKLRVGKTSLALDGTLGAPPRCIGADLRVVATGADLSDLSALTRLRLPAKPFQVSGRFLRRVDGLAIEGVEAKVGEASLHATGAIGEPPRCETLNLTAGGAGPDASWLSEIIGVELPIESFEVNGRVARSGGALTLDGVSGRLGAATFDVTGRIVPISGLAGSEGDVHVAGSDLQKVASLAGAHGMPAEPFRFGGHVLVSSNGYTLDDVEAEVGSVVAEIDGHLGAPSIKDGTSLDCRVHGPALSDLSAWGIEAKLPAEPFTASGSISIHDGEYRLAQVEAEVGANRVTIDGSLGELPHAEALDLAVDAAGPSLAGLVTAFTAADPERWEAIAAEAYTVSGRLSRVPSGFELGNLKAKLGTTSIAASGTLNSGDRLVGTDLMLDVEAPDTGFLSKLIGTTLPDQAVHAKGRVVRADDGFRLDGVSITLGPSYAEVSGLLGEPPRFAQSDIDVSIEGPDLAAVLTPITGLAPLPMDSFELEAHIVRNGLRIDADRFNARLGTNDLEGSLSVDLESKPVFDANVRSKRIDVARLAAGFSGRTEGESETVTPKPKRNAKKDRVISDEPIALDALRRVDGHLRLDAAAMAFIHLSLTDVAIDADLRDGAITIGRFEGTGSHGGRATASLSVAPVDAGYAVRTEGHVDGTRLAMLNPGDSPDAAPSLDVQYAFSGTGRSLHEMASSANGWALLLMGPGRIPNTYGSLVTSDVLIGLMDALNPFRKSSPYTTFDCGVAAVGIEAGKAVVEPVAVRGDKLTILGNGKLNFDTEAFSLVWTLKPRSGIGISAGSIANPYIKLDGTLASPKLDIKPLHAAVSTGAAVATAGLTLLFRGIYDRITAEKKVCDEALVKARKKIDARTAALGSASGER